jgi:ABC-2 type transport system permease protein
MRNVRLVTRLWWYQLKIRARSAFDGLLAVIWPMFFATSIFLMYRSGGQSGPALLSAAVGASVMGVWSATSTTASSVLQWERRQGTLELLVVAPRPFALLLIPTTLSMSTIGAYSLIATLAWGRLVFGIDITVADPLGFVVAVLVTVVAIGMLGFLLALMFVRYRSAWAIGSALEMPVWLICGFIVPLGLLPSWIHPLAWALAPTWGMAAVRAAAQGGSVWPNLLLCLGVGLAYGLVGAVLSRSLLNSARRHASLALA